MPTDYSTLGFPVERMRHLKKLAKKVLPLATEVSAPSGKFLCWAPGSGEELWLKLNDRNQVFRVSVHFSGSSSVRVGLTEAIWPPDDGADDVFRAWTDPREDATDGVCEILFDSPDGSRHTDLELPVVATAQIAAFAHSLEVHDSPDQTAESPPPTSAPPGAFAAGGSTEAFFSGRVIESGTRTNSLTGKQFVWASAQTLGGLYDVVVHPNLLTEPPAPGVVLTGTFRLSGRLLD
jgi:hypothetical protein